MLVSKSRDRKREREREREERKGTERNGKGTEKGTTTMTAMSRLWHMMNKRGRKKSYFDSGEYKNDVRSLPVTTKAPSTLSSLLR